MRPRRGGEPRGLGAVVETERDLRTLRVATTNDVLYAPQFVAEGLGLFAARGVDVRFEVTAPGYGVLAGNGRSRDLYVGSMWFCLAWPDRNDPIVPVGLSNRDCHHVLVTRAGSRHVDWITRLKGGTILVPSDAPTPFAALVGVLHTLGLGLSNIRPVPGFGAEQITHVFEAGLGDAAVLPAQEAINTTGEVAGLLSEVTGPLPWTVYSAPVSLITGETARDVAEFLGAIAGAQKWIAAHSAADIAGALRHRFVMDNLEARVHALKSRDVWAVSPEIVVDDVLRWERVLDDAGLIPPGAEGLVDLSTCGRDLLRRWAGGGHEP